MKRKLLIATCCLAATASAGFGSTSRSAAVHPPAVADLICVVVYPVVVQNQQITDQYEVCLPAP